ncbi:MAG: macro domain-containing protein [Deltaproteobacteria bacterium]|nr:macro domain-containing protein [Deltaproteobacteria bacterium]
MAGKKKDVNDENATAGTPTVRVERGSLLESKAEVIVNAANSKGFMGGGVAGAIKRAGGPEIEREAILKGPTPVGRAVWTGAGKTFFRGVIHAPTMEKPAMRIPKENVGAAMRAALMMAEEKACASIAVTGLGTGVGGVAPADAAVEMFGAIRAFRGTRLREVVLVDLDDEMVAAWNAEMSERG